MYPGMGRILKEAAEDPAVRVAAITGAGPYYSAGNDLTNFAKLDLSNPAELSALVDSSGELFYK